MRCPATVAVSHRRRGDELVGAIHAATLDELGEHGFGGLTVEGVAERAGVGKASIYRRWPGKLELTLDALEAVLPDLTTVPDTGSVRGDLIGVLRSFATAMNGPCGVVMRNLAGKDELEATVKERLIAPRRAVMVELMRRAVKRGEVRADATKHRIVEVGPMLLHAQLMRDGHISERGIVALVDDILLPMLRP